VNEIYNRIQKKELNLLESHCFQFDFLNDEFEKLPKELIEIILTRPQHLIIFINPPYAEAGNNQLHHGQSGKKEVEQSKIRTKYKDQLGRASHELFAQFLARIIFEVPNCCIGIFSKLKTINAPNFKIFRQYLRAKFEGGFIVPADTFDNVSGAFPIAFQC